MIPTRGYVVIKKMLLVVAVPVVVATWTLDARTSGRVTKPISFAILEDYDKGDSLEDVARDFELFRELEINTWRGSFGWDDYEPSRGRYDFTWLERFATLAAQRGIQLRPYIGYTPEWAASRTGSTSTIWNRPAADEADWRRFVAALAQTMKRHRNVISYEIYNEQNAAQWWDGTVEQYAMTLSHAAEVVRRIDRRMPVIFGGLVFADADWLSRVCANAGVSTRFDVLPVHAYPETWTPEGVTLESYATTIPPFVREADAACGRKSVWINETGFATVPGKTEEDQANWWVRAVATFAAEPRVEHIGIYEIKDLPLHREAIGDAPNYHLGLTRTDRKKKLAFYTVDMLTDLLDTGRITVADDEADIIVSGGDDGELYSHLFVRPDGDRVLIVWNRAADVTVDVHLDGAAAVHELGLDGTARPATLRQLRLTAGKPRVFRMRG